ncbi:MAG: hypothetical protein M1832_004983 [Thelocarpon impressellum]|nr:MAG: hypothetical protein M1832_004983 [Thelocarpon impressellum]
MLDEPSCFFPSEFENMSQYNEADWVPACTGPLSQITYSMDNSYLTPQMSCADPASFPATPAISRPRSSAGIFAPELDTLHRPRSHSTGMYPSPVDSYAFSHNALGIKQGAVEDLTFSNASYMRSPTGLATRSPTPYHGPMAVPELNVTSTGMNPIPIAPNPAGLQKMSSLKRGRDDDAAETAPKRRRRSSLNTATFELSDEERLLLRLKDEVNLPWKDIALRFQLELGKSHQVPALQMRYKRLRERLRGWTEPDVQALQQARDYWEKFKWDIIATKMLDFGCGEKWPAKYCIRKWEELHPERDASRERGAGAGSDHGSPEAFTPRPL